MPGRGRGGRGGTTTRRGKTSSTGDAASLTPEDDSPDRSGTQFCASCSKDVGDDPIGCDHCERWVHSTEMCSGLPQKVIDAITEYEGRGINFVCTKCRLRRESSVSNNAQPLMTELLTQIFQQMKGLCNTVQNLMDQVKDLSSQRPPPPPQAPPPAPVPSPPPKPTHDEYIVSIRKEVQELNEREKRRSSIIIKGISASSPRELTQKFSLMTQEVMSLAPTLTDVSRIPNHPNIYRAKILDEGVRKQVLERSKSLRGSGYSGVYISRDLTYAQRGELYARRQARRAENTRHSDDAPPPTVAATGPAPPPDDSSATSPTAQGNAPPQ